MNQKTAVYISNSKEDKALVSRADDIVTLCSVRNKPCFLGFLNERDAYILKEYLSWNSENIYFFGGYNNAKRTFLCCSNYGVDEDDYPIKAVYFKFRTVDKLSHRDFLGSLMALGIDRSCVGDILVGEGYAVCYVKSEIYDFVTSQIFKIGKVGINIIPKEKCNFTFEEKTEELFYTVSSLRLDVIVSAITGLSRNKTNDFIISGKVFVNYQANQNFSHKISQGDILTVRGFGKYIIKELAGETKKGRLRIIIEHFRQECYIC